MTLTHTPYDGSAKPFTIGLKPLDLAQWIEVDRHRDAYLAEKRRLYAEIPGKVFVAEHGTEAAQQEVLELIVGHLQRHFPALDVERAATLRTAPSRRSASPRCSSRRISC